MIKYFFIFLFLKSFLFGCSLCSIYSPKTHVDTQIKADKEYIKSINIKWDFAKEFVNELVQIYDLNLDKKLDEKESMVVQNALVDYLEPRNFITTITYDNKIDGKKIAFEVKNYKLTHKDSTLIFEYNIDLNFKIYDKNILNIRIFDKEAYFFIILNSKKQLINIPYHTNQQINLNDVTYVIEAPSLPIQENNQERTQEKINEESKNKKEEIKEDNNINIQKQEEVSQVQNSLEKFTQNIKKYLLEVQKGEDKSALFFLLMASFIYGVIHSIGPGHGKALAFSYFSSFKSTYFQAFIISIATAFVHIFGAFIIVVISVFVLESIMNKFMENSISYITNFSAVIIMFLAIYILYKKLSKKSSSCACCSFDLQKTNFSLNKAPMNFVKTTINKPVVTPIRSKKQDLIFVLTAGIIPCPGTVLLFVYAFLLKTYFAVILASISISLGMAMVIFLSSFCGVSLNKVSSNSKRFLNILEIISPIFMFILALLLLFNFGQK
jgi:ABC-type nickel/cobalt efflux system permease component RcnA